MRTKSYLQIKNDRAHRRNKEFVSDIWASMEIQFLRGGITIKIPKRELETEDTYQKVKSHLEKNPNDTYTRIGLMVEIYKHNPEDLNAPFRDWPEGAPSQYTRIRLALEKLKSEGLVDSKKQGKKFLYWWKSSQ